MIFKMPLKLCLFIALIQYAQAFNSGQEYTTARQCKVECVDTGGVFCRDYATPSAGFCCFTPTTSPCDLRNQMCTSSQNEMSKYFACPFDEKVCGTQSLDV